MAYAARLAQIRTHFATGLSEDMLSHVLKGRKDVSITSLTEALEKIGYGLQIVPLNKTGPSRSTER